MRGSKKNKVLCALSGGVDSSVAAALLVKQGYDVTAAYMINYDEPSFAKASEAKSSLQAVASAKACWVPEYRDAVRVAAKLNIPILKLDFTKEYKKKVLDYMFAEYKAGRTPNPDVLCNKYIKFGVWMDKAREMGFEYLATGHYANIKFIANSSQPIVKLMEAKDKNKDQTYFLHQLTQKQLKHVMFPIGEYTKPQVRALAKKFKLSTADKEESMGICFVGEVPMKEFLETRIKHKPGKIILSDGTVIGKHEGLAFYTIGQRHFGLQTTDYRPRSRRAVDRSPSTIVNNRPLYVFAKHSKKNELVVGFEDDPLLYKKEIQVTDVNWTSGLTPHFPLQCEVRLRHRQPLQKSVVSNSPLGRGRGGLANVRVRFTTPQRAVTPGQFAVFYKKGECLGGGVIM